VSVRILFLSQLLPLPLDAGPKIRAYYVLRHLVESGHDVSLVCFVRPTDRGSDAEALRRLCGTVETVPMPRSRLKNVHDGLRSLASSMPFLILRDQIPAMFERLNGLVEGRHFDAVHADQLWMATYAAACSTVPLKVLDQHNAVFRVPERLAEHQANPLLRAAMRREASKLERFEQGMLDRFDRVVWVNDDDRRAVRDRNGHPGACDEVIPIAVDPAAHPAIERVRPFRVTFLGGVHWPPNAEGVRWFLERVWPRVAQASPGAVFTVIGKGGEERFASAGRDGGIEIAGYVSDPNRYLAETAVFVVPLLAGAGMRVKILDAWCRGLPVVSTSIGAEGISVADGVDIAIADGEDAFAGQVVRILRDDAFARRLAENGRAAVEALYDWRKVYRAWDEVYH
jgi:polysaccharide biosynthesis protein PslH